MSIVSVTLVFLYPFGKFRHESSYIYLLFYDITIYFVICLVGYRSAHNTLDCFFCFVLYQNDKAFVPYMNCPVLAIYRLFTLWIRLSHTRLNSIFVEEFLFLHNAPEIIIIPLPISV